MTEESQEDGQTAHPCVGFIIVLQHRERKKERERQREKENARTLADRISLDIAEYLITTKRAVAIHQIAPVGPYGN